jgi:hypothetical protein
MWKKLLDLISRLFGRRGGCKGDSDDKVTPAGGGGPGGVIR